MGKCPKCGSSTASSDDGYSYSEWCTKKNDPNCDWSYGYIYTES
jgi:hypothetical protein